jgi:hypothetical protein
MRGSVFELAVKRPTATAITVFAGFIGMYGAAEYGAGQLADLTYGSDAAKVFAREQGYTDIRLNAVDHGFVGFGECRGKQDVQYELTATAPDGTRGDIDVCKSLFGGAELIP